MRSPFISAVLLLALPALSPSAPDTPHLECVDARPTYIQKVAEAIAKWENCPHNRGCLKYTGQRGARRGRNGYAVFESDEASMEALYHHIEKRQWWSVWEILRAYNKANPLYAETVLRGTGIDHGLVIAEQNECEVK